jgi:glyoxylase-like metal-dependent hydrolase (beta-lactamase superfamily II)
MTSGIELKTFSVGDWDNNVYILVDSTTSESILFDAPTDAPRILNELQGTKLKYVLFTHADGDHVQALKAIKDATGAPVGINPLEADRLPIPPDFELEDGQVFDLGTKKITAHHTPGHSPGGMCFVLDDILIAGDTLFPGGPGNTKRPDGDHAAIMNSIRTKLEPLPDDTKVYPGHGKPTTIGTERPHFSEWEAATD